MMNKAFLAKLMDDVVFPFHNYLDRLDVTKRYLDSDEKRFKHQFDTAILAVALIRDPQFAKETLQKASVAHNSLDISYKEMRGALNVLFSLLLHFLIENGKYKEFEKEYDNYEEFFMQIYASKRVQDDVEEEDDFFDFDSEFIDEEIDNMHFEDKEKISAQEFMQEESIENDSIADIADILEEFYNMSSDLDSITAQYIAEFTKIVSKFELVFSSSYEFRNIAYALNTLYSELTAFDFEPLTVDQKELFKLLLDSIIDDIAKFHAEVLVEQTALDIHYLDASLLANIAQIEMMLHQI